MFGNFGFGELMIILVIVLVLFGAKRIPEISALVRQGNPRVQEERERRRALDHGAGAARATSRACRPAIRWRRAATAAEEVAPGAEAL